MKAIASIVLAVSIINFAYGMSPAGEEWFKSATDQIPDIFKESYKKAREIFYNGNEEEYKALKDRASANPNCAEVLKQINQFPDPGADSRDPSTSIVESMNILMAPCRRLPDKKAANCIQNILSPGFARMKQIMSALIQNKFRDIAAFSDFKELLNECESQ